jgi:Uma2 family endonuclease
MATVPKHLPLEDGVYYPETDGKPMGETGYHVLAIFYLYHALDLYFERERVLIAADLFLYYEKGNPRAVRAPDVMVVKGVDKHPRHTFKTWVEKAHPCVVFEVTSANTIDEDRGPKYDLYARLGVAEYFLFDPEKDVLDPPLEGYRLKGKQYVPLKPARDGSLLSKELGLRVRAEDWMPRLLDAKTGKPLLTPREIHEQAERAEQEKRRAEQEKQRADELAAEVARLREELGRQKRKR